MRDLLRVLIVAPCDTERFRVSRLLKAHLDRDFEVVPADSGRDGLERFGSLDLDAVLLDDAMVDVTPIEFLCALRRAQPDASLPIVVLAAAGNMRLAVEALNFGACDFLVKSEMNGESLKLAVARAAERAHFQRVSGEQRAELVAARSEADLVMSALDSLLGAMRREVADLEWPSAPFDGILQGFDWKSLPADRVELLACLDALRSARSGVR